ncbi:MAG: GNAT family N-acetyltransferase [Oscillospiraceae bacterium]
MQKNNLQNSELLELLNKQRRKNSFLINTLESVEVDEAVTYGGSAAVHQKETGYWLFGIDAPGEFKKLCKLLKKPLETFYVNDCTLFSEVLDIFPQAKTQAYLQYVLESDGFTPDPSAVNSEIEVVRLDKSWTEFILTLYHNPEFANKRYIDRCIELNSGFGALWNGRKVGYVTVHLDGEIGSMVISEYARGRGVGRTLMQHITPEYTHRASIGCGFVLPDNTASKRMMENSCFSTLDRNIIWVYHQ